MAGMVGMASAYTPHSARDATDWFASPLLMGCEKTVSLVILIRDIVTGLPIGISE